MLWNPEPHIQMCVCVCGGGGYIKEVYVTRHRMLKKSMQQNYKILNFTHKRG